MLPQGPGEESLCASENSQGVGENDRRLEFSHILDLPKSQGFSVAMEDENPGGKGLGVRVTRRDDGSHSGADGLGPFPFDQGAMAHPDAEHISDRGPWP
jgi:hypothetical protein